MFACEFLVSTSVLYIFFLLYFSINFNVLSILKLFFIEERSSFLFFIKRGSLFQRCLSFVEGFKNFIPLTSCNIWKIMFCDELWGWHPKCPTGGICLTNLPGYFCGINCQWAEFFQICSTGLAFEKSSGRFFPKNLPGDFWDKQSVGWILPTLMMNSIHFETLPKKKCRLKHNLKLKKLPYRGKFTEALHHVQKMTFP